MTAKTFQIQVHDDHLERIAGPAFPRDTACKTAARSGLPTDVAKESLQQQQPQ